MLAEFFVTFREFFEMALIVGIMLEFLRRSGRKRLERYVYAGIGAAAFACIIPVLALGQFAEIFEQNEELFEGITLMLASLLVGWLVWWMISQRGFVKGLHKGLGQEAEAGGAFGVFLFAFVAVFREGLEIVLFLAGIGISAGYVDALGAVAGAIAAILLAYVLLRSAVKMDIDLFFKLTGALLLLLAAWLFWQGLHELSEAGVLNII